MRNRLEVTPEHTAAPVGVGYFTMTRWNLRRTASGRRWEGPHF